MKTYLFNELSKKAQKNAYSKFISLGGTCSYSEFCTVAINAELRYTASGIVK